jgi:L-threonylcarbamoyladenylate synthase
MELRKITDPRLTTVLQGGGVAVTPTDTIYGLVARALDPEAVARVNRIRQRPPGKPYIILCARTGQLLEDFGVEPALAQGVYDRFWPNQVSVVLRVDPTRHAHLHATPSGLAFRIPANTELRQLIARTGPLIAPSANPADQPPATTIAEARNYFGGSVDTYVDVGQRHGQPSTLVRVEPSGEVTILRAGSVAVAPRNVFRENHAA